MLAHIISHYVLNPWLCISPLCFSQGKNNSLLNRKGTIAFAVSNIHGILSTPSTEVQGIFFNNIDSPTTFLLNKKKKKEDVLNIIWTGTRSTGQTGSRPIFSTCTVMTEKHNCYTPYTEGRKASGCRPVYDLLVWSACSFSVLRWSTVESCSLLGSVLSTLLSYMGLCFTFGN